MSTAAKIYTGSGKDTTTQKSSSLLSRFNLWCANQESLRCFFLAAFLLFQGCVVVPAILLVSSFFDIGLSGTSVIIAAAGTVAVLVSNISEVPIRYIIGIFFLNLLVSIALILIHLVALG